MKVTVNLGARSYDILIKAGLLDNIAHWLTEYSLTAGKGLIVTDDQVDALLGSAIQKRLLKANMDCSRSVIPAGEASKSGEWLFRIYDDAIAAGLDRKALILALGGGVVGDWAGYAAASYMRGLRFIQIPTTLLAMVDSAVGGKTGINLPQGKNMIGAFHQPSLVLCDLDALKTLPGREFRAGLAEVIKYGVIYDRKFFDYCDENMKSILASAESVLMQVVSRSCAIKAEVVRQDETETGVRAILNFGHTMGHAIEAVAGYGKYLHGEAISIGMVFASRLSTRLSGLTSTDANRIEKLLVKAGLPVNASELKWPSLRKAMSVDKKTSGGLPRFVLANEIGRVEFGIAVDETLLAETWESMSSAPG